MIELGKTQELEIVRTKEFGVYLSCLLYTSPSPRDVP